MTTLTPQTQLANHARVIELDTLMGELSQQLQAAVIERAKLTGNKNYLGFKVSLHKGQLVVSSTPDAIALMPPPPKPLPTMKVIEVKPVAVPTLEARVSGGHIALLTSGYVAEKRKEATNRDQLILVEG